jgi:hypothetical protein
MKKLIPILLLLISSVSFSQTTFPITQAIGSKTTNVRTEGTLGSLTGFTYGKNFLDTTDANSVLYVKYTPGIVVRINDTEFWVRNQTTNLWTKVSGAGGGGTVTGANNGLSLSGGNVQLGGSVGSPSDLGRSAEISLGIFPTTSYSFAFVKDISGFAPTMPKSSTRFPYAGRIDLVGPGGPTMFINELDSANVLGSAFPSINYVTGYNQTLQVFSGLHWTSGDKHYDICDLRGSMDRAEIQTGGLASAIFYTNGNTFLGHTGTRKTAFGNTSVLPIRTVDITGTFKTTDSSFIFTRVGSSSDSVFVKGSSSGDTRLVAQSSLVASTPTWESTIAAQGATVFSTDGTVDFGDSRQVWRWNSLGSTHTGLRLSTSGWAGAGGASAGGLLDVRNTSTALATGGNPMVGIVSSGANSNSTVQVGGLFIDISNTGTTSTNTALTLNAGGATNNYALLASTGSVGIGTTAPTSRLHINSSFATAYRAITALRTLDATDYTIDCTANTFTVTLPTAVGITGRIYYVVNSGAGVITVGTTSSEVFTNIVTNPTTFTIAADGQAAVQSTGAAWIRLSN